MAKQPKLVLRESCVRDLSRDWPSGNFAEMGAGTGGMTQLFLERGFRGVCHDLGEDSRQLMRERLAPYGDAIRVVETLQEVPDVSVDYLLAFEVLEHIEGDLAALREWARVLRPGGALMVSVPAHQRKFGRSDELVGHVRRYERSELEFLLRNAGFDRIRMVNYGFPITEFTRRFSNFLVRKDRSYDALSPEQRSIRSAQAKPRVIAAWLRMISGRTVLPFCMIQRWFYGRDWGDGLVATAVKS